MLRRRPKQKFGQTIIEFTFSMIIVFLMIYSLMKIFEWTGKEFSERRQQHDTVLRETGGGFVKGYTDPNDSEQLHQISPFFATTARMNAIWQGQF